MLPQANRRLGHEESDRICIGARAKEEGSRAQRSRPNVLFRSKMLPIYLANDKILTEFYLSNGWAHVSVAYILAGNARGVLTEASVYLS